MLAKMKIAAIILLFAGAVTALVSAGKNSSNDLANNTEAAGVSVPSVFTLDKVTPAPKGKAHNFTWKDGSKTVSFADYTKGKVVLLNFWGTWCGPCRMEIPDIIGVSKDLKDKDFVVIGIPLENDVNNAVKKVPAKPALFPGQDIVFQAELMRDQRNILKDHILGF